MLSTCKAPVHLTCLQTPHRCTERARATPGRPSGSTRHALSLLTATSAHKNSAEARVQLKEKDTAKPSVVALDRTTGVGYVAPHKGDYADALSKRFSVVLFNMETSGAVGWRGVRLLRTLAKKAKRPGHRDGTIYGTARSATSSFFTHHLSAIAAAVALADAPSRSRPPCRGLRLPDGAPTRPHRHARTRRLSSPRAPLVI